jgi:putative intracellular protease/amidase
MSKILTLTMCALLAALPMYAAAPTNSPKVYACPECGKDCDKQVFDKAGACPGCGMELIEKSERDKQKPVTVAVLLFDGVEIIDYSGPWEVFGEAGFKVHTVAEKRGPITAIFGQKLIPDYTFKDSPAADILLVPGGNSGKAANNPAIIKWIQGEAQKSKYVMSVCTGAFLLSKAGLLDGLSATTVMGGLDRLAEVSPKTKVVHDQRYVDNGKVITTAGLSSGIDGAFHLLSKIKGKGSAQAAALGMEYRWDPDSKFARAALADRYLPQDFDIKEAKLLSYESGADSCSIAAQLPKSAEPAVIDLIKTQIISSAPHMRGRVSVLPAKADASPSLFQWTFTAEDGSAWAGTLNQEAASDSPNEILLKLSLIRQSGAANTSGSN